MDVIPHYRKSECAVPKAAPSFRALIEGKSDTGPGTEETWNRLLLECCGPVLDEGEGLTGFLFGRGEYEKALAIGSDAEVRDVRRQGEEWPGSSDLDGLLSHGDGDGDDAPITIDIKNLPSVAAPGSTGEPSTAIR